MGMVKLRRVDGMRAETERVECPSKVGCIADRWLVPVLQGKESFVLSLFIQELQGGHGEVRLDSTLVSAGNQVVISSERLLQSF